MYTKGMTTRNKRCLKTMKNEQISEKIRGTKIKGKSIKMELAEVWGDERGHRDDSNGVLRVGKK